MEVRSEFKTVACRACGLFVLLISSLRASGATVVQSMPRAEILWERTVCREPGRYIGWPSVTQLENGDLIAVFSGDRAEHICPFGKVQAVISQDGGETWSGPATVADTPLDDRDAGVSQLPNGDVVVTWFTQVSDERKFGPPPSEEVCRRWIGNLRAVSKDNGRTWSAPEVIPLRGRAPHGPILTHGGVLLNVGRTCAEPQRELLQDFVKPAPGESAVQRSVIACERSEDGAKTWRTLCADIPDTNGENAKPAAFWEPSVTEYGTGKLLALVRYHGSAGMDGPECLRKTRSEDGGRSWSRMTRVPLCVGWSAPHVITLADGRLLCSVGRRQATGGNGEWAYVSDDAGETWHNGLLLSSADGLCSTSDFGYPCTVQLKDGALLTVFYQVATQGERPSLRAVKWRLASAAPLTAFAGRRITASCGSEPLTFRGPDGKELRRILREKLADGRSQMSISSDEGKTWSPARPTPWSLCGEHHRCVRLKDGRYCITFWDTAPASPTRGDFIAWVGPYAAISSKLHWTRVRRYSLIHDYGGERPERANSDLRLLADGTPLAVTCAKVTPDAKEWSWVEARVLIDDRVF